MWSIINTVNWNYILLPTASWSSCLCGFDFFFFFNVIFSSNKSSHSHLSKTFGSNNSYITSQTYFPVKNNQRVFNIFFRFNVQTKWPYTFLPKKKKKVTLYRTVLRCYASLTWTRVGSLHSIGSKLMPIIHKQQISQKFSQFIYGGKFWFWNTRDKMKTILDFYKGWKCNDFIE